MDNEIIQIIIDDSDEESAPPKNEINVPKLLKKDIIIVKDLHQICKCCLRGAEKIFNMADTLVDGHISTELYTELAKIKISTTSSTELPTTICRSCLIEMGKFKRFQQICKNSHKVLQKAAAEIALLKKNSVFDLNMKVAIVNEVLQQKMQLPQNENIHIFEVPQANNVFRKVDLIEILPQRAILHKILPKVQQESNVNVTELNNVNEDLPVVENLPKSKRRLVPRKKPKNEKLSLLKKFYKLKCSICNNIHFSSYADLEMHLRDMHSLETTCIVCQEKCTNPLALLYHVKAKHGNLKCCRLCFLDFETVKELTDHFKSPEHNTVCRICHKKFHNRKALCKHRKTIHFQIPTVITRKTCPQCGRSYGNSANLGRHIRIVHKNIQYLCDNCGQCFTTLGNLNLHIKKIHEGAPIAGIQINRKNFICETCGKDSKELKLFTNYQIAVHRRTHTGDVAVCRRCLESFKTDEEFKKHLDDFGHHPLTCEKCGAEFTKEEYLQRHLKNHDAPGWNKNLFTPSSGRKLDGYLRNENGNFQCRYCDKCFKLKQPLIEHERVHTNERPYKCEICSKAFKTMIHRKTHMVIHTGIKKYACQYCSKTFATSSTLSGHVKIHTGERPHRCSECGKGFISTSGLKKHKPTHFKDSMRKPTKTKLKVQKKESDTEEEEEEEEYSSSNNS